MPSLLQRPYLHLVPIEPGECLSSWLLRVAARYTPSFQRFSTIWFLDELRVTPGFDAFPAASLLMRLGAIPPGELGHYISHHTLLGTTKCFYTADEWEHLIHSHGADGSRLYALRQKVKQKTWHLCPTCRSPKANRNLFTWPRNPQMPGILLCSEHEVPLVLDTSTRIPPLDAPAEKDICPSLGGSGPIYIGREEDHLTLARDVAGALAAGLGSVFKIDE